MIGGLEVSQIRENEFTAKEISMMLHTLVMGTSQRMSPFTSSTYHVTYEFWDSFFHGTLIDNFEKIYLCYLIKMEFFMGESYIGSSVYYFGEIVNHLLKNTYLLLQ